MSRPWLKFFPSDWRADPQLRVCSISARGLWMEMLCLMHEATPYGTFQVNGKPVTQKQLAALAGISTNEVESLLCELHEAGVYDEENGIVISRRMQRDEEKAQLAKDNGSQGGNPKLKGVVNQKDKGEVKAQKPDTRSQIPERKQTVANAPSNASDFENFKKAYPKRRGANPPGAARERFDNAVKSGVLPEKLIMAAKRYFSECEQEKIIDTPYVAKMSTFLSPSEKRWEQYLYLAEASTVADMAGKYKLQSATDQFYAYQKAGFKVWDGKYVDSEWPPGYQTNPQNKVLA